MPLSGNPNQPDVVAILTTPLVGSGSWPVPVNFDHTLNIIEVVGGGGGGASRQVGGGGSTGGGGGGGGGYIRVENLDLTASSSIEYTIGVGGAGGNNSNGDPGGPTQFALTGSSELFLSRPGSGGIAAAIASGGVGGTVNSLIGFAGSQNGVNGQNGFGLGEAPPNTGRGGSGSRAGSPSSSIGDFWFSGSVTGTIGSGGIGGSQDGDGFDGQLYGAGGGGGGGDDGGGGGRGGDGSQGLIVITYRSTLHQLDGFVLDEDVTKMSGMKHRMNAPIFLDDDAIAGRGTRRLFLGQTSVGSTVARDEELVSSLLKFDYKLHGTLLDLDKAQGSARVDFTMTGSFIDTDTTLPRMRAIIRHSGTIIDETNLSAALRKIQGLSGRILDEDKTRNAGLIGVVKLQGTLIDDDKQAHIILDPTREVAFFVDRPPTILSGSAFIEEAFTGPRTLHGFRFRPITIDGIPFEVLPVQITLEPPSVIIKISEAELIAMGLLE